MAAIAAADLNGSTATHARLSIPAWGASYHDVTLDADVTLSGPVTLTVADLVIKGTILSGGPSGHGKSFYRIVAGAGGWGKTLPRKSYSNDAGVKLATVLGDAAAAVGETLDPTTIDTTIRLGPAFVRAEGPACRLLEQLASQAWRIDEDGVTRLGQRPPGATLNATATRTTALDLALSMLTLASDTIANILPGITVDGLTAVDVEHEISAKEGLRSKIWGSVNGGTGSRLLAAQRKIFDQLDASRRFRGVSEYRVVTQEGERLNLQPVRVVNGMPDLGRVMVRPGVPGFKATHTLGSRVLVAFADSNPGYPFVVAFEDAEGGGFSPTGLFLSAGGKTPTEHLISAEAVCLLIYNVLSALCTANSGPMTGAAMLATISPAIGAAITEMATPAPAGQTAQAAAAAAQSGNFATGAPASTVGPFGTAIASALGAKTDDVSGLFPSVGFPAVKGG